MRFVVFLVIVALIAGGVVAWVYYPTDVGQAVDDVRTRTDDIAVWVYTRGEAPIEERFDLLEMERQIFDAINAFRVEHGRYKLQWDVDLAAVARAHSADMAANNYSRHINLVGDDATIRARKVGYICRNSRSIGLAENIHVLFAHTHRTDLGFGQVEYDWMEQDELTRRFVDDWVKSLGHRRIILDRRPGKTGIGVAFGTYWGGPNAVHVTQNFC